MENPYDDPRNYPKPSIDMNTFSVDEMDTDEGILWVDVFGRGTVCVRADDDGIVVDIYPFHVVDAPVASVQAHMSDLVEEK